MNDENNFDSFHPNSDENDSAQHTDGMENVYSSDANQSKDEASDFLTSEKENESGFDLGSSSEPASPENPAETTESNTDSSVSPEQNTNGQQTQNPNPYQQPNGWNQGNYGNNGYYGNYYGQPPYNSYGNNNSYNQNHYRQYGQYNNQYSQHGPYNPYGQNNPYGNYGQTNPVNPENQADHTEPNGQPDGINQPQYAPQFNPQPPKRKMSAGLKAFLWSIGTIAALFVIGFFGYGIYESVQQYPQSSQSAPSVSSQQPESGSSQSSSSSQGSSSTGDGGSVTNPGSTGLVLKHQPSTGEMHAKDVYKRLAPSVVGVITTAQGVSGSSQGSGIIASSDGYIITNAHVINYSKEYQIKVVLNNKKEYKGTVVGYDKTTDLAVIKINAAGLTAAEFGYAEDLSVGDSVLAIGNPGGIEFSSSLTGGLVSALNRAVGDSSSSGMTYIQTDAAINPGNSGGALVNMYGQVVGINSSKIVATGYEGMGFAIPISKAKSILDVLISKGYVSGRSRLGITAKEVSDIQVQAYGMPEGIQINSIDSESNLKSAGVMQGDIITKADGKPVATLDALYQILTTHKPGDSIKLTIYRVGSQTSQGKTFTVMAKLLEDKG